MGLFYSNHKNIVKVRALTGRDEILLCSPYLAQTGSAMKLLFNNVVLEDDIEYEDLLVCDRDAILLFIRSTTYGDDIDIEYKCSECGIDNKGSFKISSIEAKELNYPPDENGEFEFIIPNPSDRESVTSIKFKPINVAQSKLYKGNTLMEKYMSCITSINNNSDKEYIFNYIKNLKIKDSKKLREFIERVEPGFEEMVMHSCPSCGHQTKDVIKIDETFMFLPDTHRKVVDEECFLAYYYSKGGIKREEAYSMPVIERRWSINRIIEEIEKQNKAEQEAIDKAKNKR
jgi:predicted RNA-binding Zn-ribbon protein involved in translation (DUF1610 family)